MASQNSKVIGLAIAGAVGGFLFGFDSSVVNGAIDAIKSDFALGDALLGITVAIALLGCAVGAFIAGRLADRLNGAVEAMVPSQDRFFSSDSTSRSRVRSITWPIRPTRPRLKLTSVVLGDSRHSSMAVANISAMGWSARLASWR